MARRATPAPKPAPTLAPTLLAALLATTTTTAPAQDLTLPAYTAFAHPDPNAIRRDTDTGAVVECRGDLVFYVDIRRPGALTVTLLRTPDPDAQPLELEIARHPDGAPARAAIAIPAAATEFFLATFELNRPGMRRLVLRTRDGAPLRGIAALRLSGPAVVNAHASTVERRNAASVHLAYEVPTAQRDEIEWFYCEVTPRTDPLWTFYMATGWRRGYFGMQVNSPTERRILFSVWDAGGEPVDRDRVAAEDRVQLIAKGEGVYASGFGNEGTGGHSHKKYDWKLGDTFRFLVHARPDGTNTTYTGWFWLAKEQRWDLIASFRAPKDGQRLRGIHSFNENFAGSNGDLLRDCEFGNGWVRTSGGEWLPLLRARFTHDGHGDRERLDRSAGVRGDRFFLRNGGFLPPLEGSATAARTVLELPGPAGKPPETAALPQPPAGPADK